MTYSPSIDNILGGFSQNMEKAKVRVSPKFQVVIPKILREELKIEPGQELLMYSLDGSLRLVPRRSIKELRGMAKGLRWKDEYRDHAERF
ncbi:MAG TPA: AbrB/MazE/SpoVT family DNA-binding domain-containing protein [Candidatus Acidoferrales bacterium]|nr:AbrB/MazE/SpoVT family DNA-binding domain-containing protein [Candidatus Acidoferrales bacterium]